MEVRIFLLCEIIEAAVFCCVLNPYFLLRLATACYHSLKRHTVKWIAIVFLFILAMVLSLRLLGSRPVEDKPDAKYTTASANITYSDVSKDTNERIVVTEKLVMDYVKDMNGDGKVNCVDHAVLFKIVWDTIYPRYKKDCVIIRNRSADMHHLFNGVYDNKKLIFVEPWTSVAEKYMMKDNWSTRWNPNYNIYGETDEWLGKVKTNISEKTLYAALSNGSRTSTEATYTSKISWYNAPELKEWRDFLNKNISSDAQEYLVNYIQKQMDDMKDRYSDSVLNKYHIQAAEAGLRRQFYGNYYKVPQNFKIHGKFSYKKIAEIINKLN